MDDLPSGYLFAFLTIIGVLFALFFHFFPTQKTQRSLSLSSPLKSKRLHPSLTTTGTRHTTSQHVYISHRSPFLSEHSRCIPQCDGSLPSAWCPGIPFPELGGGGRATAKHVPASMEQPRGCEDGAFLVSCAVLKFCMCDKS